jgi:hypothetical protein
MPDNIRRAGAGGIVLTDGEGGIVFTLMVA